MGKSREEINTQLKEELSNFFEQVNSRNFYMKYDELQELILKYRYDLNKNEILEYCHQYYVLNELNDYQIDVYDEILGRITGYCTPDKDIPWD